ncbi:MULTISPECIES: sel1 repeat family protein [unclassified Pseudomonas]|uniref:sel1 repeat family protein n=1 Tax=unclassified Pseudomonas TaxID=196821 RepID=UPI0030DA25FC
MKLFNVLPLALLTVLAGCATKELPLNDTLPKLTLQNVLPVVTANEHCNAQMDSDILYGVGYRLYENGEYKDAKTCMVMAAPKHTRAFCYLSMTTRYDSTLTADQRNTEAFNYMAYAATQNDWCAEYGMYESYKYGKVGTRQDAALATRWLERSSLHGYAESQQILIEQYEELGNLSAAYAWTRIMAKAEDTTAGADLKAKMNAAQIAEGDKLYSELVTQVTSKKTLFAEAREEDVGRYSADIYQNYPDTFKGMSSVERYDYVKQTMRTAIEQPFTKNRGDVVAYIVLNRAAQLKKPDANIATDPRIVALMEDQALSVDEAIESGLRVVNTFYR